MRGVIRSFFIVILPGFFTVTLAQLPPKIIADKHLTHAEQLYAAKDYAEAFNVMEKIIALQKEHSLTLSDEFYFKYAQVALAADSTRIALEAVTRYLSATGREGEFYKEALVLLLKAEGHEVMSEEDFYNEVIKTQGTCEGLPKGSKCWQELTNHPECYVWNNRLEEGHTATWTGKCSDHLPDGRGTLTWRYIRREKDGKERKERIEITVTFQKGKPHGPWVMREEGNVLEEGSYVDGKRHGPWVENFLMDNGQGSRPRFSISSSEEGSYVDDKRHGQWVSRFDDGKIIEESYVNDKLHGPWVMRDREGNVRQEGPYVDGLRHGPWVERYGTVHYEGSYVEGTEHGPWVERDEEGNVRGGGSYVEGAKHGQWIDFYPSWVSKGRYVNGEREGTWLEYDDGVCSSIIYKDGDSSFRRVDNKRCRQAGLIP